jgi:hypothetical protein
VWLNELAIYFNILLIKPVYNPTENKLKNMKYIFQKNLILKDKIHFKKD